MGNEYEEALSQCVETARKLGVVEDQVRNFLSRGYVPLPWQWRFHALARSCDSERGPVKIGVGGARGPGKSHGVFAQVTLDDCQRVKNLKGLFLRQTGTAARESFGDLVIKILARKVDYTYNRAESILYFKNGSRVVLGGFHDERDVDKYVGIEYDFVAIEELNQLTFDRVERLLGSMRTSKPNWRPRMYASFNPGGIGHVFVKETFVEPARELCEEKTKFVPARYSDNPWLNREYIDYLENLGGNLGRAWRDGDFDIFEGQYFNEWRNDLHVVNPYEVPTTWKRIRCIDHGRTAPTACMWGAIDYDGNIVWYREYYMANQDADRNAQEIKRLSEGEKYSFAVMDSACYSKTGFGETIAEIYERNGVYADPAPKNRLAGWNLFHEYLRGDDGPKMKFFSTCVNAIRTIPTLIHDSRAGKLEDLDTTGEDHCADAISYGLQYLHESKSPVPLDPLEVKLQQFKKQFQVSPQNLNKFYGRKYA